MHDVENILKFENPFVQNFYLNYSLRNIELNIHLPFNSMYFETCFYRLQVDRYNRFVAYASKCVCLLGFSLIKRASS